MLFRNLRLTALVVLLLFAIVYVIISNISFNDSTASWSPQLGELPAKIENVNDYDAACSGYSLGRTIREQYRIRDSVRTELGELQAKLEENRLGFEELQKSTTQKQLELSQLEGEIEAAQRQLEELRETRNVKVFLPFASLEFPKINDSPLASNPTTFDNIIDYSRCSISTFMPISVETITQGSVEEEWKNVFKSVIPNLVDSSDKVCLNIKISNGILSNSTLNTILFNIGTSIENRKLNSIIVQEQMSRLFDYSLNLNNLEKTENLWQKLPPLLPLTRKNLITMVIRKEFAKLDVSRLSNNNDIVIKNCKVGECYHMEEMYSSSMFCLILPDGNFSRSLYTSLKTGCIPIILSNDVQLPFQDVIDWRRASYRLALQRLPEAHFIIRSFKMEDVLEMRRMGRNYYENYLATKEGVARSLISALRYKLQIPTMEIKESRMNLAQPLFNSTSFTSPKSSIVNQQQNFDDDMLLGPLESRIESSSFAHNFSEFQLYSYNSWNYEMSPHRTKEFSINAIDPPAESEFYEDTKIGFRPIEPGSGLEFSRSLGGNQQREQFTIVILTYERDTVLVGSLERLNQLPYLNKVIVVWNNINREPPETWPSLHVPIEFIKVPENSLNNRFVPWNRIETEAVLSLDDDIDLMPQEIVLAFRVWRENRDRIVGFPARYHARYGDSMFYNSNHTCQMSIILTGAAFLHKSYLTSYTYDMPSAIRDHIDQVKNCEDIAMNYLVSHLTRKPPIKTTSRWTLKCATCTEKLSESDDHFDKRHECMRLFTKIYGYNPLKFSQFRADSILFKTRLPQNHQKCFKYV